MIGKILAGIAEHRRKFLFLSVLFHRNAETIPVDVIGDEQELRLRLTAAIKQGWEPAGFVAITENLRAVVWPLEVGKHEHIMDEARRKLEVELFCTAPEALEVLSRMDVHINSIMFLLVALVIARPDDEPLLVLSAKSREERLKVTNDALQHGGVPLGFVAVEARPGENGNPRVHAWPLGNFAGQQDVYAALDGMKTALLKELEKLSS